MGCGEAIFVDKGQCCFEQSASDTAAAHTVVDNKPAQMRNIRSEIFAVDRDGADDLLAAHCNPDRVLRAVQPVAKSREALCYN